MSKLDFKPAIIKNRIKEVVNLNKDPEKLHTEIYAALFNGDYTNHILMVIADFDDEVKATEEERAAYVKFQEWLLKHAKQVAKMQEPITLAEYLKIRQLNVKLVTDLLLQMHNKKDLLKRYVSAYRTLTNWYRNNEQK